MYYTVEIGSRGHITKDNINRLTSFKKNTTINVKFSEIKANLCTIFLIASSSLVVNHSNFEET